MSERDLFAAYALQAIITVNGSAFSPVQAADLAYLFANAMMLRRRTGSLPTMTQTGEVVTE